LRKRSFPLHKYIKLVKLHLMSTKQHKITEFYIVLILHCFLCIWSNFTSFIYLCKVKDFLHKIMWMIV